MTWLCRRLGALVVTLACVLAATTERSAGADSQRQRLVDRVPAGQPVPSPLTFTSSS